MCVCVYRVKVTERVTKFEPKKEKKKCGITRKRGRERERDRGRDVECPEQALEFKVTYYTNNDRPVRHI